MSRQAWVTLIVGVVIGYVAAQWMASSGAGVRLGASAGVEP